MIRLIEFTFKHIISSRSLLILILAANLLFLLYLLLLGGINRLSADDYMFAARLHTYGFWGSIKWWYEHWQGRFTAHFLINTILYNSNYSLSLFLYTAVLTTGFIIVLYKLSLRILELIYPGFKPDKFLILNYAILLFNFFLLINVDFSTYYWLNVSIMYFGGLLLFLVGLLGLLTHSSPLSYLFIIIGFTGAGSSAEHLSAIIIVSIFAGLFFIYISKKEIPKNSILVKKLLLAGGLSILAFIIMFFAPGNDVRLQSIEYRTSIPQAFLLAFKSTYTFIWQKLSLKVKYIPLLIVLFLYFGSLLPEKDKKEQDHHHISKLFLISSILLLGCFLLNFLLMGYATGNEGPGRAQVYVCFVTVIYFAFNSILLGSYTSQLKSFYLTVSLAALLLHLNSNRYALKNNFEASLIYSQDDHVRVNHLISLKNKGIKDLQVLDPIRIPDENIFYPNFIVDDSTYFEYSRNIHLEEGLGLPFKVMLKKDKPEKENTMKGTMREENAMAKEK